MSHLLRHHKDLYVVVSYKQFHEFLNIFLGYQPKSIVRPNKTCHSAKVFYFEMVRKTFVLALH